MFNILIDDSDQIERIRDASLGTVKQQQNIRVLYNMDENGSRSELKNKGLATVPGTITDATFVEVSVTLLMLCKKIFCTCFFL